MGSGILQGFAAQQAKGQHLLQVEAAFTKSTLTSDQTFPPQHETSNENLESARRGFLTVVGPDGIDDTPANLKPRASTDWSPSLSDKYASLIVFPQSTLHVSKIMKICHRRRTPVTGFSGGTSLDGALSSTRGGVCIDSSRMNRQTSGVTR